ncbi:MAG: hypothetical protein KAS94_08450, partial [Desulfobulbaceae bacterium]|nr:hypothetical protein [Desulfobulbaceae bacterium]
LGDCQMTNQIISAIQKTGQVRWVTAKGFISSKPVVRLKTVAEVIKDPEPDQFWMDKPMVRIRFYIWVDGAGEFET